MKSVKVLLLVDAQDCFISGCLGSAYAQEIVPYICGIIKEKKVAGYRIIATQDTHGDNYFLTREGKKLPVMHGNENDQKSGWPIEQRIGDVIFGDDSTILIRKSDFGSFRIGTEIKALCERAAVEDSALKIYIVGYCTDVCVVTNAIILRQQFPEAEIVVDSNGCAGVTRERHQAALEVMRSCQITVI